MIFGAFLTLLFAYSAHSACATISDTLAEASYVSCQTNVILTNAPVATKAASVCTCLNNLVGNLTPNCDANTLSVDAYCAGATALNAIGLTGAYDFSTCSACATPPASPLLPSACSTCIMKLVSCATTGYFNLQTYPAVTYPLLSTTCNCVGSFYNCFAGCGSPASQYLTSYCQQYSFCNCDGSVNTVAAANLVTYLKSLSFAPLHAYVLSKSGVLSIDCATKTTAAGTSLDSDRFICDINFASAVNYTNVHLWVGGYIGKSVNIVIGSFPSGPLVATLKRDNLDTELTSATTTYTFQVTSDSARMAAVSGALLLVLGLFIAF